MPRSRIPKPDRAAGPLELLPDSQPSPCGRRYSPRRGVIDSVAGGADICDPEPTSARRSGSPSPPSGRFEGGVSIFCCHGDGRLHVRQTAAAAASIAEAAAFSSGNSPMAIQSWWPKVKYHPMSLPPPPRPPFLEPAVLPPSSRSAATAQAKRLADRAHQAQGRGRPRAFQLLSRSRIPTLEVGAGRPARRRDHTTGDDGYGMKLLIVGQQS